MYKKAVTYPFVFFSALFVLLVFHSNALCQNPAAPNDISYVIQDIRADLTSTSATITFIGNTTPAYTTHEQVEPFRLVMDIAAASLDKKINSKKLIPNNQLVKLTTSVINDQTPPITQFIFQIKDNYQYKVDRDNNNLIVRIFSAPAEKGPAGAPADAAATSAGPERTPSPNAKNAKAGKGAVSDATLDELIDSSVAALEKRQKKTTPGDKALDRASSIEDPFTNAGYKKQRISVDFYKIDIHNVFRLFRQISDVNIVVDEAVKGSVTIALNDVPWDFALDIICNLAGLKKEERLNTIVIYPKDKTVEWPVSPIDNLSIKADKNVIQQEALIVQQTSTQSKEVTQAKEVLVKAQAKEKSEDFEAAVSLYEQAFTLWPANERISNKLAVLYLVNLRMNAKALYYAQESLKAKHNNPSAALYAGIASANMERLPEAMGYFDQSVSGSPPLKEALLSYAAFCENYGRPEDALKLLNKYSGSYGETLQTMLAKARIYDKMGNSSKALAQYNTILRSGYQVPPDLQQYIQGRLKAGNY
jgi:tetratricopeptide (TPR) repeat protein